MAHETAVVGSISELMAKAILMKHGWEVSVPVAVEAYDLIARDPYDKEMKRIQVKTMKVRRDMDGRLVVNGSKSSGKPYTKEEADYIACIYGTHLYLVDNTQQTEYTVANTTEARNRWRTLPFDDKSVIPEVVVDEIEGGSRGNSDE